MKNVLISLFALAAISSSAFASDQANNNGNNRSNSGAYARKIANTATDNSALIVVKSGKKKLTAFERINLDSGETGRGDRGAGQDGESKL